LSETLRAIETSAAMDCFPCVVKSAKFFQPTRPGDHVRIEYSRLSGGGIRFRCVVNETAVLSGEMKCNVASMD
jgi:hypothetical protein